MNRVSSIAVAAFLACVAGALPARAEGPAPGATPPPQLAVGDVVPAFEAEGVDGTRRTINFPKGGNDTLLMFFLSGCPACHKMLPLWNAAFARRPANLTIFGVILDREPPGWFMATPLSFSVLRSPGGEFNKSYKLYRVPMTLRVKPGGIVRDIAVGPVDAIRLGEFFQP